MQAGKRVKIDFVDLDAARHCPPAKVGRVGTVIAGSHTAGRFLVKLDDGTAEWIPHNWLKSH